MYSESEAVPTQILVVEDETPIRRFVKVNLEARGYEVIEAGDAEGGLHILRDRSPDVLVLDIRLPGMSGWDLLRTMSEEPTLNRIPVIVMTASATNVRPDDTTYANVAQWLVKPVSVIELIRAVKKVVSDSH